MNIKLKAIILRGEIHKKKQNNNKKKLNHKIYIILLDNVHVLLKIKNNFLTKKFFKLNIH